MKDILVIEKCRRWNYFQWFILGFYKLQERGQIKFKVKTHPLCKASFICPISSLNKLFRKLYFKIDQDSYYMDGYIQTKFGKRTFTIDCADTPYMYDYQRLKDKDIYFKIQCPKDLDADYFALTDTVRIPWIDSEDLEPKIRKKYKQAYRNIITDFHEYTYKIKPLMVGPRELAIGNSYYELKRSYNHYISSYKEKKSKIGMCYFGDAKGPRPSSNISEPDFGLEYDLMGWFGKELNHPNEKRLIIANFLKKLGEGYDARVINSGNADSQAKSNPELIIPLKDFEEHVSKFQYNYNVSGFTLSIPGRFIDSFMVGTAVVTDSLKCRWYKNFEDYEVIETVDMGYLPVEQVDWDNYYEIVKGIKESNPAVIKRLFEEKWSPDKVSEYIIDTLVSNV